VEDEKCLGDNSNAMITLIHTHTIPYFHISSIDHRWIIDHQGKLLERCASYTMDGSAVDENAPDCHSMKQTYYKSSIHALQFIRNDIF
jgi:hypothetical protein